MISELNDERVVQYVRSFPDDVLKGSNSEYAEVIKLVAAADHFRILDGEEFDFSDSNLVPNTSSICEIIEILTSRTHGAVTQRYYMEECVGSKLNDFADRFWRYLMSRIDHENKRFVETNHE